jgi:glutaconyl-CoA/methylmalonyl-CoA decarboxylase subunit gamma
MKMFKIRVNGNEYEVEVEEISHKAGASPVQTVRARTPQPVQREVKPAPAQSAQAAPTQGGAKTILSPMPGTIVDVQVGPGEKVTKGQTLMILEAMKMENEILAPHDCTVVDTHIAKGASVNAGDLLLTLA